MFRGLSGSLPVGVSPDLKESGINAVYLGGPWLGLPNRDYYLEEGNEECPPGIHRYQLPSCSSG